MEPRARLDGLRPRHAYTSVFSSAKGSQVYALQRASQALDALEIEAKETGFESGVDLIEQTFPRNQDTAPNWFPCFHLNAALVAHLVLSLFLDLHPMTPQDQEAMRTLMDAVLPSEGMWDGGGQEGLYSTTTGRSCLSTWQEFERSIKLNVNNAW